MLPFFLIALGNLLDYASTKYGMRHGCYEANPLVATLGLVPMKVTSTLALARATQLMPRYALHIGVAAFAIHSLVALHNLHQAHISQLE